MGAAKPNIIGSQRSDETDDDKANRRRAFRSLTKPEFLLQRVDKLRSFDAFVRPLRSIYPVLITSLRRGIGRTLFFKISRRGSKSRSEAPAPELWRPGAYTCQTLTSNIRIRNYRSRRSPTPNRPIANKSRNTCSQLQCRFRQPKASRIPAAIRTLDSNNHTLHD